VSIPDTMDGGDANAEEGLTPEKVAIRFKKEEVCAYFYQLAAASQ